MLTKAEFQALTAIAPASPAQHRVCAGHGERHWKARLTNDQVRQMRERYAVMRGTKVVRHKYGYAHLAKEFGCSESTAKAIVMGWTRKEAGGPTFDDPHA